MLREILSCLILKFPFYTIQQRHKQKAYQNIRPATRQPPPQLQRGETRKKNGRILPSLQDLPYLCDQETPHDSNDCQRRQPREEAGTRRARPQKRSHAPYRQRDSTPRHTLHRKQYHRAAAWPGRLGHCRALRIGALYSGHLGGFHDFQHYLLAHGLPAHGHERHDRAGLRRRRR